MKKHKFKRLGAFALSASLSLPVLALQTVPALANPIIFIDQGTTGSLPGRTFRFYRILDCTVSQDGDSYHYSFYENTKSGVQKVAAKYLGVNPEAVTAEMAADLIRSKGGDTPAGELTASTSEYRYFIEELREAVKDLSGAGHSMTVPANVPDGTKVPLVTTGTGFYLVDEVNPRSTGAASLCLALTPTEDITITLKGDAPSLIKQIEEDDNETGWNDIGDFETGQTIPYRYTTAVPQISGYAQYYFAFHDKMDEALDFLPDTLSITLSDGSKTYTLKPSDYTLDTAPEGETFQVRIDDLKAIVDREFYDGVSDQDHDYGQSVAVRYDGTLNEKAYGKEGRPGFENTARLEYSNDPDTNNSDHKGFTAWDTVVAFTYRIDGTKINEKGSLLSGAQFALYSDEACTQQIKVQKMDDAYMVIHADAIVRDASLAEKDTPIVSNETGEFEVFGLDQGTYYLKETKAPDGYRLLEHPIVLTVSPEFTEERNSYIAGQGATETILKSLSASATLKPGALAGHGLVELNTNADSGTMNLTVTNHTDLPLPLTGSAGLLICLSAGTLTAGAGLLARKRRKR